MKHCETDLSVWRVASLCFLFDATHSDWDVDVDDVCWLMMLNRSEDGILQGSPLHFAAFLGGWDKRGIWPAWLVKPHLFSLHVTLV